MIIKTSTAEQILLAKFNANQPFLEPILFEGALSMLYAPPGQGKSYFALWIAAAVAGGGEFLKWKAPRPRKVLYLDGEMGRKLLQKRLAQLAASIQCDLDPGQIVFVCNDEQPGFTLPYISDFEAQRAYLEIIETHGIDVVIIDNYGCSTLAVKREGDTEVWARVRGFFLKLRALGKAVVLVHHAGKSGLQLGTSEKEQIMNWIIKLNPCESVEYKPDETQFRVTFEKPMRDSSKEESADFISSFRAENEALVWTWKPAREHIKEVMRKLKAAGIADALIQRALSLSDFQFILYKKELHDGIETTDPATGEGLYEGSYGGIGSGEDDLCF